MTGHDVLHYLDDVRGAFGIATFAWNAVKTNVGAELYLVPAASLATVLIVPRTRQWVERFFTGIHAKLDEHHKALLEQNERHHAARLRQARYHHQKAIDLANAHHEEHMAALKPKEQK